MHIQNRWLMLYIVTHTTLFERSLNRLWFTLKKVCTVFLFDYLVRAEWTFPIRCAVVSVADQMFFFFRCSECVCVNKAPWKEFLYLNHFQCFSFPWTSLFIASSKFQGNCTFVHIRSARYELFPWFNSYHYLFIILMKIFMQLMSNSLQLIVSSEQTWSVQPCHELSFICDLFRR